jgi:DNA helicase II / ATP-dependent DNA helicase PcrA
MHTPTLEQTLAVTSAVELEDNLIIYALAGAAKTSTLILIAEALKSTSILCLAFNKKIANEMQSRLPPNCTSMTLNSLGHRVWGEAIGRRLQIEPGKVGEIIKELIETLEDPEEKNGAWENFLGLIKAVGFGKQCGYIPDGYGKGAKPLMDDGEFQDHYEEKFTDYEWHIVKETTKRSLDKAWAGFCDYDDQILMPTIFPSVFPRFPLVLIDEAQDLSALNHAMLKKLAKKRLIAVGDPCQAIYGFRGAHEESMELLEESFKMKKLELTISFRCPIKVVEHSRWRAPKMQYPNWAKEGFVSRLENWSVDDLPPDAAIICRNNAPLFSLAIKLLQSGRYAQLIGNDIGKGLLRVMGKFGPGTLTKKAVLEKIDEWAEKQKQKVKNKGSVEDRAECMRIFAMQGKTLSDAIAYAEHVFAQEGPIKLMTGHKSKGLEFDHVYFLDRELIGDAGQERNLRYVIITRAKETLTYINSEDLLREKEPA